MSVRGRIADVTRDDSLASWFRRRRFARFRDLLSTIPPPVRVLDVGGTPMYWQRMNFSRSDSVRVVILNVEEQGAPSSGIECIVGDARSMDSIGDAEFDVVFSNSVIEHVGDWDEQRRMANEIQRVGRRYFVQTPNRYFPLEPHFLVPGFQFLPARLGARLIQRVRLGNVPRVPDPSEARALVSSIRLLTARELQQLFPEAMLLEERVLRLTKSYTAIHGWPVSVAPGAAE